MGTCFVLTFRFALAPRRIWHKLATACEQTPLFDPLTDSMWVAGIPALQQTGRQVPPPSRIPVLLGGTGTLSAMPRSSPVAVRPGKWSGGVVIYQKLQRKVPLRARIQAGDM